MLDHPGPGSRPPPAVVVAAVALLLRAAAAVVYFMATIDGQHIDSPRLHELTGSVEWLVADASHVPLAIFDNGPGELARAAVWTGLVVLGCVLLAALISRGVRAARVVAVALSAVAIAVDLLGVPGFVFDWIETGGPPPYWRELPMCVPVLSLTIVAALGTESARR